LAPAVLVRRPDPSATANGIVTPEIERYLAQAEGQKTEMVEFIDGLSDPALAWREAPGRWSIAEHLAHLPRTIRPYLQALDDAAAHARRNGLLSQGPYRHGWIGTWFERTMEPPVRLRMPTLKRLVPEPAPHRDNALADSLQAQDEIIASLRAADGVDLGRARFQSPFARLLKLSIGAGYGVVLAHNRRHLWSMRRIARAWTAATTVSD
jgi:hypothetical protein